VKPLTAIGVHRDQLHRARTRCDALALRQRNSGLRPCRFETVELATYVGEVDGIDAVTLRADLTGTTAATTASRNWASSRTGCDARAHAPPPLRPRTGSRC
jgi:hypothetical protein